MGVRPKIIDYCTGGLGNRLRSLASCFVIAEKENRDLYVYWDTLTPNGCLANFDDLFNNKVNTISLSEMESLDSCYLYAEYFDCQREESVFNRKTLLLLANKFGSLGKDNFKFSNTNNDIVVFNNNFLSAVPMEENTRIIKQLIPKNFKEIEEEAINLKLDKNIIGVHARGCDFNITIDYYINEMNKFKNHNFFLTTDDLEYEKIIVSKFPNRIIKRERKYHTNKIDNSKPWSDHNNLHRTKDHVIEAVTDMYLLSKTNILIFHPDSTYAQIAKILSS